MSIYLDLLDIKYECRKVRIRFTSYSKYSPKVAVDGSRESPHRYNGLALCMWYPKNSVEQIWVFEDGLLELLAMIEFHLYSEALWRESGKMYGPEAAY